MLHHIVESAKHSVAFWDNTFEGFLGEKNMSHFQVTKHTFFLLGKTYFACMFSKVEGMIRGKRKRKGEKMRKSNAGLFFDKRGLKF